MKKNILLCLLFANLQSCNSSVDQITTLKQQIANLEQINKLKSQLDEIKKNNNSSPTSTPIPASKSTAISTPTATSNTASTATITPPPIPTPTAMPTPIPTPTATPTPIPTPTATPTPTAASIPIPANYPIPTGLNKCRAWLTRSSTLTNVTLNLDWASVISFKEGNISGRSQYGLSFRGSNTYPSLWFWVPNLNTGSYSGNQANTLAGTHSVYMAYYWDSSLKETSIDDDSSEGNVTIEGSVNGYIWGSLSGRLGKLGSRILVVGKFSCIP